MRSCSSTQCLANRQSIQSLVAPNLFPLEQERIFETEKASMCTFCHIVVTGLHRSALEVVPLDNLNAVCASRARLSHLGLEGFGLV